MLIEERNVVWSIRAKACLIQILSVVVRSKSVAYRSFVKFSYDVEGVRKVTTGIAGLWQPSVQSDVAF